MVINKSPKISENFNCIKCDFTCSKKSEWKIHVLRPIHTKDINDDINDDEKTLKNSNKFNCIKCDFVCSKKSEWNIHVARPKHLKCIDTDINYKKSPKNSNACICGKKYKHYSGLWRHKNICNNTVDVNGAVSVNNNVGDNNIICIIEQNKLLLHLLTFQTPFFHSTLAPMSFR